MALTVATADERIITNNVRDFAAAPDGERLLVLSNRAGSCTMQAISGNFSCSQQLYLLPATGGALERLGSTDYKGAGTVAWLE